MTTQIIAGDFYDYDAAEKEGWFISYAPGNLDETIWRLERRDENPVFLGGDPEAHTHVVERAMAGSKLHQDALDFLRTHEPREYEIVLRNAMTAERDQALAKAAAAAVEMRERAADVSGHYMSDDADELLLDMWREDIYDLPIEPNAQKALDKLLMEAEQRGYANAMEAERKDADQRIAKAREDAIREAAALCAPKKARVTRGNRFTPSTKDPQSAAAQVARKQCQDAILALLTEERLLSL